MDTETQHSYAPDTNLFSRLVSSGTEKAQDLVALATLPFQARMQRELVGQILDHELEAGRLSEELHSLLQGQVQRDDLKLLMMDLSVPLAGGLLTTILTTAVLPPLVLGITKDMRLSIGVTAAVNASPVSANGVLRAIYSFIRSIQETRYLVKRGSFSFKHGMLFTGITVGSLAKATYFLTPLLTLPRNMEISQAICNHYLAELCIGRLGRILQIKRVLNYIYEHSDRLGEFLSPVVAGNLDIERN